MWPQFSGSLLPEAKRVTHPSPHQLVSDTQQGDTMDCLSSLLSQGEKGQELDKEALLCAVTQAWSSLNFVVQGEIGHFMTWDTNTSVLHWHV